MQTNGKISIISLINRTGLYDKELADRAKISEATLANIKSGKKVKEKTLWRLINFINALLGTSYEINDIEGIRY